MDCPFCNLDQEKDRIVKEGMNTLVILSNPRKMPGHLLVISKRHVERISELNRSEKEEIFNMIAEFQEKILDRLSSGCDIRQHYRPFIKQSQVKVNHLHFHLQPREFEDELYQKSQRFETAMFKELPKDESERIIPLLTNE